MRKNRVQRRKTRQRKRRAAFGLVLVVVVAGFVIGCAPKYQHCATTQGGGDNDTHVTVSGAQPVDQTLTLDVQHTTREQAGATWTDTRTGGANGSSLNAVRVRGTGNMNCMAHGTIWYNEGSTNWNDWHYRSGLKVEQPSFVADQMVIRNEGDSVKVGTNGAMDGRDFRLSRSWLDGSHDDCFQNDDYVDGVFLEGNLMQCYVGISARQSGSSFDGSARLETLQSNIVVLQPQMSVYKGTAPGTGGWIKWEDSPASLKLTLTGNTFVAFQLPNHTGLGLNAPVVTECSGNTIDWLGPVGTFPSSDLGLWSQRCPGGYTFLEGPAALLDYQTKVAQWHADNPGVG